VPSFIDHICLTLTTLYYIIINIISINLINLLCILLFCPFILTNPSGIFERLMAIHLMNICAKFHPIPSTTSCKITLNSFVGQSRFVWNSLPKQ